MYFFPLLILQVAAYFAGQVSGVDKREGKEKEKERGNGKKKFHLFPSSKGFLKMLTCSLDGNVLYGVSLYGQL